MTNEDKIKKLSNMAPVKCEVCMQTIKRKVIFESSLKLDCACGNYGCVWSLPDDDDPLLQKIREEK